MSVTPCTGMLKECVAVSLRMKQKGRGGDLPQYHAIPRVERGQIEVRVTRPFLVSIADDWLPSGRN